MLNVQISPDQLVDLARLAPREIMLPLVDAALAVVHGADPPAVAVLGRTIRIGDRAHIVECTVAGTAAMVVAQALAQSGDSTVPGRRA